MEKYNNNPHRVRLLSERVFLMIQRHRKGGLGIMGTCLNGGLNANFAAGTMNGIARMKEL